MPLIVSLTLNDVLNGVGSALRDTSPTIFVGAGPAAKQSMGKWRNGV